jgi:hypothetical protein
MNKLIFKNISSIYSFVHAKFSLKVRLTSKVMQNLTWKIGEIREVDILVGLTSYTCRQAR